MTRPMTEVESYNDEHWRTISPKLSTDFHEGNFSDSPNLTVIIIYRKVVRAYKLPKNNYT